MKLKHILIAILAISITSSSRAQNKIKGSLKADFVSSYIWRGLHLGHVSLQPELSEAPLADLEQYILITDGFNIVKIALES